MSTVVIWMIIFQSIIILFAKQIKKNGWITKEKKKSFIKEISALFAVSAIPIIRVVFAICFIMMGCTTKEKFDEWVEANKR